MIGRSDIKPNLEKRCTMCGARLSRKRNKSGRLEDFQAYLKRQFCSLSCANSRLKGGLSRKAFHAQARKKKKPFCGCCGTTTRLQVHHIDEDWTNNTDKNLQTLCIYCHQFWHKTHLRRGAKMHSEMPAIRQLLPKRPPQGCSGSGGMETPSMLRRRKLSLKVT